MTRFWFYVWQKAPFESVRAWGFRHWIGYQFWLPEDETGVDDPRLLR